MDAVVTRLSFSSPEVRRINYCRLYLQVLTISDMCNTILAIDWLLAFVMDNIYGVKANLTSKKSTKNAQMKPPGPSGAGFSTLSLISTDTYTAPLVTGFSLPPSFEDHGQPSIRHPVPPSTSARAISLYTHILL
jgi:hypothetical protein